MQNKLIFRLNKYVCFVVFLFVRLINHIIIIVKVPFTRAFTYTTLHSGNVCHVFK